MSKKKLKRSESLTNSERGIQYCVITLKK